MCKGKSNSGLRCKSKQDFMNGYCRWHVVQDPEFEKSGLIRCKGQKSCGKRCNFTDVMPTSFDFLSKSIYLALGFPYCGGHIDQYLMQDPVKLDDESEEKTKPEEKNFDLVFMDLETTGLDLIRDEFLECYMESRSNSYESFVTPTVPISEGASKIHKMDDKFLKDRNAKTLNRQLPSILAFLEMQDNPIFVAHNGDRFDYPMILFDCLRATDTGADSDGPLRKRVLALFSKLRYLDTCKMAKSLYPELERLRKKPSEPVYSVEKLSETFGVKEFDQEHRARSDVKIMIAVFEHMLKDKKLTETEAVRKFAQQMDLNRVLEIYNAAKKNLKFEEVYEEHFNSVEQRLKCE